MPWSHWAGDLVLVGMAVMLASASILLLPDANGMRIVLTLSLVLVLPGYVMMTALFPGERLGMPDRLVLTLGLSIALVILAGLVLNVTPWGLQAGSLTVIMSGVTLAAGSVAAWRRRRRPFVPSRNWSFWRPTHQMVLVGLAVALAGMAMEIAVQGASQQTTPGFTQLSILPMAHGAAVHLHVANMESGITTYTLRLTLGGHMMREWSSIRLAPGATWSTTAELPLARPSHALVAALLYRTSDPTLVYRRVLLWTDRSS